MSQPHFDSPERLAQPVQAQALPQANATTALALPGDFGGSPQTQVNVFKMLHQLYRGRFAITIAAALLCGILCGLAAWLLYKPGFQSVATVRVQANTIKVLDGRDETMSWFPMFVQEQVNFLQQPRVITAAMNSPDWLGLQRPLTPDSEKVFKSGLKVFVDRSSPSIIIVTYTDPDANAAFIAVREVVGAYEKIFVENQEKQALSLQQNLLQTEKSKFEQDIKDTQAQLTVIVQEIGTNQPDDVIDFLRLQSQEIGLQIMEIENRLAGTGALRDLSADKNADIANKDPALLTREEIAMTDMEMASLLRDYNEAIFEIDTLMRRGLGQNHAEVKRLRARADALNAKMEHQRLVFLGQVPAGEGGGADATLRRLSDLKAQLARIEEKQRQITAKAQEYDNKKQSIEQARLALQTVNRRLDEIRLQINVEQQMGRITVLPPEAPPKVPSEDSRKRWSAMLFILGLSVPVLGIGVWGLVDRRYRYSDEALQEGPGNTPLLGILPRLPSDLRDQEQASAAAHCVHQIRTLIQLGKANNRVYACTSSNPGDGKTSMALSLALSFAGSGSKTLIVDLDMIGQGLSRSLRMREQSGLYQSILDGSFKNRVRTTHIERLWLLPTGLEDDHRAANRLSEGQIVRLIESLRNDYDIVLIDTGPVLGSIEAHLVCAQADGVILVVGAGRARGQVKAAVDQLNRVGAKLLGLVFNLAQPKDFKTSAASQSFRSVRPDDDRPIARPSSNEFAEFEPLPRVVALDTKR
jgi:capsular exopolysaccharide synthesis family protein